MAATFVPHHPIAQRAMQYLDASPDPFHATQNACDRLEAAGFTAIDEKDAWTGKLNKGGKYYFTRNRSCIVAFAIGGAYEPGNGFKVIGAHTDSPNLRVKPRSKRSAAGCTQLDVECYGGGLWHTWFDRDLSLSGRVMVRASGGGFEQRLVRIHRPVLRVPTLCIHLQSAEEREAFKVNKEDHLQPILATEALKSLTGDVNAEGEEAAVEEAAEVEDDVSSTGEDGGGKGGGKTDDGTVHAWSSGQEPLLVSLLAEALEVETDAILDFECSLYDTQPASLSGLHSEFLVSSRLDNLASCFVATEALIEHADDADVLTNDRDVALVALFDHEEVGSSSTSGAGSPVMGEAVRRISSALSGGGALADDLLAAALANSFVVSADMAHAVHPNYASKHEKSHGPQMNRGLVIKSNANQRYASNGVTSFVVRELARRAGLPPPQEFVVRNDCPCGSTIGPIISANTGMRAVDVGMPQLSMHSVREVMGVADLTHGKNMFKAFFADFRTVDGMLDG